MGRGFAPDLPGWDVKTICLGFDTVFFGSYYGCCCWLEASLQFEAVIYDSNRIQAWEVSEIAKIVTLTSALSSKIENFGICASGLRVVLQIKNYIFNPTFSRNYIFFLKLFLLTAEGAEGAENLKKRKRGRDLFTTSAIVAIVTNGNYQLSIKY